MQSADVRYLVEISGSRRSQILRVSADHSGPKKIREDAQLRWASGFRFVVGKRTMITWDSDQNLPPFSRTMTILTIQKLDF